MKSSNSDDEETPSQSEDTSNNLNVNDIGIEIYD